MPNSWKKWVRHHNYSTREGAVKYLFLYVLMNGVELFRSIDIRKNGHFEGGHDICYESGFLMLHIQILN